MVLKKNSNLVERDYSANELYFNCLHSIKLKYLKKLTYTQIEDTHFSKFLNALYVEWIN